MSPTVWAGVPGCQSWSSRSPSWMTRRSLEGHGRAATTFSSGNSRAKRRHEAAGAAATGGKPGASASRHFSFAMMVALSEEPVAAGVVEVVVGVDQLARSVWRVVFLIAATSLRVIDGTIRASTATAAVRADDEARVGDAGLARRLHVGKDPRAHLPHACGPGGPRNGPPRPPSVRTAPAEPWRSSIARSLAWPSGSSAIRISFTLPGIAGLDRRVAAEGVGRALELDAALVHHVEAVGERQRHLERLLDQQERGAPPD